MSQEEGYSYSQSLLNSLKFLLDFYYGKVPIDTILLMSGTTEDKFWINNFFDVAKEAHLHGEAANIPAEKVSKHLLPVLLYDRETKPLILIKLEGKKATLYSGEKNEIIEEDVRDLNEKFSQVIYFFRDKSDKELIDIESRDKDWFFKPIKEEWRGYVEVGILTIFINFFILALPLYTMSVYDRVIPNFATSTLKVLALGLVFIFLFDIIFKGVRSYIIESIGKRVSNTLEEQLMKKLLTVQGKYDTMLAGAKANLFKELNHVREFFASKTMINILDFPFFILLLTIIYLISPTLAIIPIIGSIFILVFNYLVQIPITNIREQSFKETQSKHSFLIETIQGGESIKLSNAVPKRLFEWRQLVGFVNNLALKMQMFNTFATNISQTAIQIVTMGVIFVGVFEIHDKNLSIGGLIAVTILSSRVMVPIVQLSSILMKYKEFKEALNTLNGFWYLPDENAVKSELGVGRLEGNIEFKDVDYYYKKSKTPSIKKLNIDIKAGEKVAIIGQTGAGKSTLLRLLTGLDNPTAGKVLLDSHDTASMHNIEIRKNIGVMPQEPFLFSGTLKENIELSSSISKERLAEVINKTGLGSIVAKGGKGDALDVGEGGKNLSIGQRHLVTLARAILYNPPILVLDEPTTGLDIGLEKELIKHIKDVASDKTLILITHRMAALELVDRVIVLKDGQVAVNGPRDKVLAYLRNPNGQK